MWINAPTKCDDEYKHQRKCIYSKAYRNRKVFRTFIQCQSVCVCASPAGGVWINLNTPSIIALIAAALTPPGANKGNFCIFASLFPARESIGKPAGGNRGLSAQAGRFVHVWIVRFSKRFSLESWSAGCAWAVTPSVHSRILDVQRTSPLSLPEMEILIFQLPQLFHIQRFMLVKSLRAPTPAQWNLRCRHR